MLAKRRQPQNTMDLRKVNIHKKIDGLPVLSSRKEGPANRTRTRTIPKGKFMFLSPNFPH
jgi:hypothetical protein